MQSQVVSSFVVHWWVQFASSFPNLSNPPAVTRFFLQSQLKYTTWNKKGGREHTSCIHRRSYFRPEITLCSWPDVQIHVTTWSQYWCTLAGAASIHSLLLLLLFLFLFFCTFFFFNLVLINRRNGPRYQRVPALCAFFFFFFIFFFFNRGNTERTNCSKIMFDVCVLLLFSTQICVRTDFADLIESVVGWLVCRITRRQTEVGFRPWNDPLRLTGVKAPTN